MEGSIIRKIAERIREARCKRGLTQRMLADMSGVPQSTLSAYERAAFMPTAENLLKIARALRVDIAWLMGQEPQEVGRVEIEEIPKVVKEVAKTRPLPSGLVRLLESPLGTALRITWTEVGWLLVLGGSWEVGPEKWLERLLALRRASGRRADGLDNPDEDLWRV
ncbi:MAG TPA: XRE family transcriptional regulator [Armatimonadetes bacterium]|nr:XRE family transcriptional regulator [Armatimonadota bacterium]